MIKVETRRNAGHALARLGSLGGTLRRSLMRSTMLIGADLVVAGLLIAVSSSGAQAQQWLGTGAVPTDYNSADNWVAGNIADAGNETANFGLPGIGGSTAVNLSAPVTVEGLTFDSLAPAYSLTGSAITFDGTGLRANSGNSVSIANTLAGNGSVVVNGIGAVVTLSGVNNSYSGATTITEGVLEVTGGNAITDTSAVTVDTGGTFRVLQNETIGSLASTGGGAQNVVLTGTLTTGGNNGSTIFDGAISGMGGLTKVGTGTFTLSGTNTYSGTTTVNGGGGVLRLSDGAAIGDNSAVVVTSGTLNVKNSETIGTLSGAGGALTLDSGTVLTINQATSGTLATEISGDADIVKQGVGTLTLSGANDAFDGIFTLSAGQITLADDQALGNTGGADENTRASNGTTIDYADGVNINENIVVTGTVSFNQTGGAATQSGVIGGGGSLAKTGSGRLVLTNSNTYTGATTISEGTLEVQNNNALNDSGLTTIQGTGLLQVTESETIGSLTDGGVAGGAINIDGSQTLFVNQASDRTFGGTITGDGIFRKQGSGTLTFTGDATLGGGVVVSSGDLSIGDGGAGGTLTANVTNNSELIFNHNTAVTYDGNVSGSGFFRARGAGQLTLNGDITNVGGVDLDPGSSVVIGTTGSIEVSSQAVQLQTDGASASLVNNGTIRSVDSVAVQVGGGNGSLDLTNSGTIDSVNGTYAVELGGNSILRNLGTGTIEGGTSGAILLKGGSGAITVDLAAGSTVNGIIRSQDGGARNVTIGGALNGDYLGSSGIDTVIVSGGLNGNISGGAGDDILALDTNATLVQEGTILDGGGDTDTFVLAGTGSAGVNMTNVRNLEIGRKIGSGTFTLSNRPAGDSFQGGWSFEGGTVVFIADDQFGSTNGDFTFNNGATLSLAAGAITTSNRDVTLSGDAVLDARDTARLTLGGVISGSGNLTKTGSGTLVIDRENTYGGLTQINGGTVRIDSDGAFGSSAAGTVAASGTTIDYASGVSNADALQLNGQVTLLQQGTNETSFQTGAVTGTAGAELAKFGNGTLVLDGSNGVGAQFEGVANINGGILQVNGTFGDTVGNTATVNVNTGGTLQGSGTIAGNVFVNGGGIVLPGNSPGTINIGGDLTLNAGSSTTFELSNMQSGVGIIGGGVNDLINVGGQLSLNGTTINLTGGVSGYYRLFNYGSLVNNGVTLNRAEGEAQLLETANGLNVVITMDGQIIQHWDGSDTVGDIPDTVDGGTGTWTAGSTNWTTSPGAQINDSWRGDVAVFGGAAGGTVTLVGAQSVEGMQFMTDGYVLQGDPLNLTGNQATSGSANANASYIVVDDGITATINSVITGLGLDKMGSGTLVLGAANTYGGGTDLQQGGLVVLNSGALGSGRLLARDDTRVGYGDGVALGNQVNLAGDVTFDQSGGSATQVGVVVGDATDGADSITKSGNGALSFTQLAGSFQSFTSTGGVVTAVNTGTIDGTSSPTGNAINADGTLTDIDNRGAVRGSLASSGAGTFRFTNATGAALLLSGTSNLLGASDTITNNGVVDFGANGGPGATLAGAESFINNGIVNAYASSGTSGNFTNAGTIDLVNGSIGETFTVGGNFTAGSGSILAIDVDLGNDGPDGSDRLIVDGSGFGASTQVNLNNISADGRLALLTNPILVADFTGPNTSAAPTVTNVPRGLITYDVIQDAAGDWFLTSRVNSELIGGFAANFSSSQSLIAASLARPSSSFVSAPIQPEANETGYSPWIRAIGGVVSNSSGSVVTNPSGEVSGADADVGLQYAGVQGGFDIGRFNIENSAWNVNLGVTGGYNSGTADQKAFDNKTEFNTAFIGTYVAFSRNNFFGEIQGRWDYTDFDVMAPDFSDKTINADTKRFSLSGSAGYAIEIDEGSSFVPSVGLSYSTLNTSTIQTDLGNLAFDDTDSLIGYLSGTLAKTIVINDDTGALTPFITGTIYSDFGEDTTSYFSDINGATAQIVTDNIGTYGEFSLGLNYRGIFDETRFGGLKDLTAGVRADFSVGEELSGAGLTGQIRLQF